MASDKFVELTQRAPDRGQTIQGNNFEVAGSRVSHVFGERLGESIRQKVLIITPLAVQPILPYRLVRGGRKPIGGGTSVDAIRRAKRQPRQSSS